MRQMNADEKRKRNRERWPQIARAMDLLNAPLTVSRVVTTKHGAKRIEVSSFEKGFNVAVTGIEEEIEKPVASTQPGLAQERKKEA